MFLDGGAQVKDWLVGNFPNIAWLVVQNYNSPTLTVEGYYDNASVIAFQCGENPHTEFLDITIEHQLGNPHHLWESFPEGWAGEHVEIESTIL